MEQPRQPTGGPTGGQYASRQHAAAEATVVLALPDEPDEATIDADLKYAGFDPDEDYPEYGHEQLREAYREGWSGGRDALKTRAQQVLVDNGHADTCGSELGDYPCSCWKADLESALAG